MIRDPQDVLHGPFDPVVHKETFVNYLEVVILTSGTVEYAVPSHQGKMEAMCREMGVDPVEDCPRERYGDYMGWLMEPTGAIPVWSDRYLGDPNARQRQSLLKLASDGLLSLG